MSRPRTLPSTMMSRDPLTWLISAGPSISSILATEPRGTRSPPGALTSRSADRLRVTAHLVGIAHDQREPPLALQDLRDLGAPERFHHRHHVGGVDAVAGHPIGLGHDLEHGQPAHLLGLEAGGAGDARDGGHDLVGLGPEHVEVLPEDLDGQIGPHPGDELVHPQFDRLGVGERQAGNAVGHRRHLRLEVRLGCGPLPLLMGLQRDDHVADVHAHRVGGDLGPASLGEDGLDLVGEG